MHKSFPLKSIQNILLILPAIILLASCSAGGGETGTGQNDTVIVKDTSVSIGVITGFGSVFVNNVEYETLPSTTFNIDGLILNESDLAVGMLVTISGNVNADGVTGSASSISFENNVEGFVTSNDLAAGGDLIVLGQSVLIDNETIFDSKVSTVLTVENIAVGQVVEVSGYSNGDGNIYATRIELKRNMFSNGEEVEIKGVVSNVTSIDFTIGTLTVNYENAALDDFDALLKDGDFVSVKSQQGLAVNNVLIASKIKLKNKSKISIFQAFDKENDNGIKREIEFEGIVSAVNEAVDSFVLNTETILITGLTEFKNGDVSNLIDRVRIKIKAKIDDAGNIVAEEIKFRPESVNFLEGPIENIDFVNRVITIYGVDFTLNNSTRLKDDLDGIEDRARQFFNFTDLSIGDYVEVTAFSDAQNDFITTKLERKNPEDDDENNNGNIGSGNPSEDNDRELKGRVTEVRSVDNIIVVSGVEVDVEMLGFNGQLNDRVEIHIIQRNGIWIATEIDIQDD